MSVRFQKGDKVTRGDGDTHMVVDVNDSYDSMETVCIVGASWIKAGEHDWAHPRRYTHAGDMIDASPVDQATRR